MQPDGLITVGEESLGNIERETHTLNVAFIQASFLAERPEILAPSACEAGAAIGGSGVAA